MTQWTLFEDVTHESDPQVLQFAVGEKPGGKHNVRVYRNSIYQVIIREVPRSDAASEGDPRLAWLSIKARDQSCRHDWRELQRIKNELLGTEWEGVELYPAESRLVDTSNQFHLWCFEPPWRFPFGFGERLVADENAASAVGAKQRPFDSPPAGTVTAEDLADQASTLLKPKEKNQ